MNITIDQYVKGFEDSVIKLPEVFREWDRIDPELQEEYADQLNWMINYTENALHLAKEKHRYFEIVNRLTNVRKSLSAMREPLARFMQIEIE